ncbi:MAG: hypothetical protein V4719_07990 [Planctomycetota bacterium]
MKFSRERQIAAGRGRAGFLNANSQRSLEFQVLRSMEMKASNDISLDTVKNNLAATTCLLDQKA